MCFITRGVEVSAEKIMKEKEVFYGSIEQSRTAHYSVLVTHISVLKFLYEFDCLFDRDKPELVTRYHFHNFLKKSKCEVKTF